MSATPMNEEMSHDEAQAGYLKYMKAWDDADIPWNKKGSPHRLRLKAKWYARHLPINRMIAASMRYFVPKLVANITTENVLLKHLMHK